MSIRTAASICTLVAVLAAGADKAPVENPRIRVERATTEPESADAQDARDYPRVLPKTGEARGWVKTEPVTLANGADLKSLVRDDRLGEIISLYPVRLAARCVYRHEQTRADVTLIEAATGDDAFGILSVYAPGKPHGPEGDGSFRSIHHNGSSITASACQGVYFVLIVAEDAAEEAAHQAVEALLARILFSASYSEPPLLVRVIPAEKLPDCRIWVVRRTEALRLVARHGEAAEESSRIWAEMDFAELDRRLGLKGDALFSVAAVRTGETNDVIWIVEYPQAAAADAAYDRYATGAKNAPAALDADTTLAQPFDRFLLGSWTAEAEKSQHLLPLLRTILPEPVPPPRAPASSPSN